MISLWSAAGQEALRQASTAPCLLGFDFDGTLAPIVSHREDASLRTETQALFSAVCSRYPVAVITGRSSADVRARLGTAAVKLVVGNHGIPDGLPTGEWERAIASAGAQLRADLHDVDGVEIEDKRLSLAIHYRHARDKRSAGVRIRRSVRELEQALRVVSGKQVINLVPRDAPHKGEALDRLRTQTGAVNALYVGDDVTDEDVFSRAAGDGLLTIRVGSMKRSRARYCIAQQGEIDRLLRALLAFHS